jgi:Zn-dependent alcohol dehydrogenase
VSDSAIVDGTTARRVEMPEQDGVSRSGRRRREPETGADDGRTRGRSVKAAVLHAVGRPLVIEDLELDAPRAGEVLVRIEAAGMCHSDVHYMTGDLPAKLPIVPGHEGSGVVEALGPATSGRIRVGDRVALLWRPRCGECEACVEGNPVLCRYGRILASTNGLLDGSVRLHAGGSDVHHLMGVSCFAERVVVSESSVLAVPDGIPAAIAAISACAVITGVGAAMNAVERGAGRSLVVMGAGGVGLAAVMGAALIGASPVIAIDVDPEKLELARRVGASMTLDGGDPELVDRLLAATGGGAHTVLEAVGRPETIERSFAALRPGGTLVAVGLAGSTASFAVPVNELVQRQKHVVGALYGGSNPRIDLPRIFALYLAGRLPLDALVGRTRPLDEVDEAVDDLRSGAPGRTILVP